MILDCCSAGSAVCEKGEGMIEGLYASGFGMKTPVSGKYAFTTNLVERLRDWCTKGVTVSHLHHDLTQNLKNSESNNSRQQAAPPQYIRPAELPREFRTIELTRADSFVTALSTMAAPSIRLQPLDSGSRTEVSRGLERGLERPATEAFTASGSILEFIGQVQDYEELDVPGNTGIKFVQLKDPETVTISDRTTIRHSVLRNYFSASEGDEVPSDPQTVDVEEMAYSIAMPDIIAADRQANREFLVEGGSIPSAWPKSVKSDSMSQRLRGPRPKHQQRGAFKSSPSCEECLEEHYKCVTDTEKESCIRCKQTRRVCGFWRKLREQTKVPIEAGPINKSVAGTAFDSQTPQKDSRKTDVC